MDSVQGVNESRVKQLLTETQGDLYLCAQGLGITLQRMDHMIRFNPTLAGVFVEIQKIKADPEYTRQSHAWFVERLQAAGVMYRIVGFEVLHEIATMTADTAAMMEVKRKAAASLKGEELILRDGADVDREMQALREEYEVDAPRIRESRLRLADQRTGALLPSPINEAIEAGQPDTHALEHLQDLGLGARVSVDRD